MTTHHKFGLALALIEKPLGSLTGNDILDLEEAARYNVFTPGQKEAIGAFLGLYRGLVEAKGAALSRLLQGSK